MALVHGWCTVERPRDVSPGEMPSQRGQSRWLPHLDSNHQQINLDTSKGTINLVIGAGTFLGGASSTPDDGVTECAEAGMSWLCLGCAWDARC